MTTQMKLIIPLLDSHLTKEDVSPEAGFIDAYACDKNRPWMTNEIFLMYSKKDTLQYRLTEHKLCHLDSLAHTRVIYVNKQPYIIYALSIIDLDIKNLLKGLRHTKISSHLRFVQFWGSTDDLVNRYLACPNEVISTQIASVPEEDYLESLDSAFHRKNKGLSVEMTPKPLLYSF